MQSVLPNKYYLGHAHELFGHVEDVCAELLDDSHRDFLQRFYQLSADGQCLLIRLLARKPKYFSLAQLNYPEISNLNQAVQELILHHYLSPLSLQHWADFVAVLTKPELLAFLQSVPIAVKTSTSKAQLVAMAQQALTGNESKANELCSDWIAKRRQAESEYILFLYFGDLNNRLQKFAMRDLGVLKTRNKGAKRVPRFTSKPEAKYSFRLHQLRRDFRSAPSVVREQAIDAISNAPDYGEATKKVRDKLVMQVAEELYCDSPEQAIRIWQMSDQKTAVEKWVRAAFKLRGKEGFRQELESLRAAPLSAENKLFVEDFYQRMYQGKRTSVYTDMLRECASEMSVDESYLGDVEQGVIQKYRQRGEQAWFTENKLWHVLFAFTFWPILYGSRRTQHCDFDSFPAALRELNFYRRHSDEIEAGLELLEQPDLAMREFTKIASTRYGYPTGLFRWTPKILDSLNPCVRFAPPKSLASVLRAMTKDYRNCNSGYPDIMVVNNEQLRFEEIKAPGDSLRPNQLLSIERLREAGLQTDICQVRWDTDPNQVYAVVDIETTGGRRGGNSITEIAVVRVQAGEIVSQWSSLINPDRPIPNHITRLTGINNQMVANAPRFAEIVDELDEQLENAIFVAHNVGFDYGFIKAAYQSTGRAFKRPKYCTVQQARKAFPRLKSYSLGNLAAALDIDLKNAHRALSDATATAHVLQLIQQRQAQEQS